MDDQTYPFRYDRPMLNWPWSMFMRWTQLDTGINAGFMWPSLSLYPPYSLSKCFLFDAVVQCNFISILNELHCIEEPLDGARHPTFFSSWKQMSFKC